MKKSITVLAAVLSLALIQAYAQDVKADSATPAPAVQQNVDGDYSAQFAVSAYGRTFSVAGQLTLKGAEGTWRTQMAGNNCLSQLAPVTVTTSTDSELKFVAAYSKTLKDCPDFNLAFKRVDDKTFTGSGVTTNGMTIANIQMTKK